ncbi:TPA: hypothetical protein DEP21_00265 [Patescibacteria group bacterium]|nr:hypothetical protein [Candidatus Gracilibacteria bacterium]
MCSFVFLGHCFMRFFCAGSRVSAVSGHISPIRSMASICTALIAIGTLNNACPTRLVNITNNSPQFDVMEEIIVFFRFW